MLGQVDTTSATWPSRFPRLFEESYLDYAAARIAYFSGTAPDRNISSRVCTLLP